MRAMLHSITFIKSVHTVIFIFLSACLTILLYEVIADQLTYLTWIALTALLTESVVLMANGWQCPITIYAENVGATHGRVSDIFLPKWCADHIFPICGSLFVGALLLLVFRLLW